MSLQELAQNVRRWRTARKLSQEDLANAAGVSLPAIRNLERAKSEPRMKTVQAIARALEVKLEDLFRPVRKLETVRFRSAKRMQNRENILAIVARWLENFNYLEKILNKEIPFKLEKIRERCSRENIEETAELCRQELGLKSKEPIHDICGLLEHAGVKVYPIRIASESFFGLSIGERDGGPAIAVNVWDRITIERQIFSAAHELGHLILHPDAYNVEVVEENEDEEQEANNFAGHFLMPDKGFRKEWNEASGLHWVDRVFKVKGIYRVSYKAVLYRLVEHGIADDFIWKRFNQAYKHKYNKSLSFKEEPMAINTSEFFKRDTSEPFGLQNVHFFEDRFSRLTREAVEKDEISLSRGAEILNISIAGMRDLMQNWEKDL